MQTHKLLPILWVLLLLSCVGRAHAQVTSGYCGRETVYNNDSTNLQWQYNTTDHVLTISGNGRMKDYSTDTPAPWHYWNDELQRVVIGDGVTTIGTYAMWDLFVVDSVQFGNALETIREYAFFYCTSLRSVYFKNNVQSVEYQAFVGNDSLKVVDFGESPAIIHEYSFAWLNKLQTIRFSKVKEVYWYAFHNCSILTDLNLGDSLLYIMGRAFEACYSLPTLHIPASVQSIDDGAFAHTYSLDTITVSPANTVFNSNGDCNAVMRTSNNYLVVGCRRTVIPANTKGIESSAFEGCSGLMSATLPEGIEYIGSSAFANCSNLHTINFPNSITGVGCYPFRSCSSLQNPICNTRIFAFLPVHYKGAYVMPNTIKTMCCGAFYYCDSVTNITLSDSLTRIPSHAFYECRALTAMNIPDAVTDIDSYAFSDCYALTSITIPANMQNLGESVFGGCNSLKHITWNAKDAHLSWFFYNYTHEEILNNLNWGHPFYNIRQQIQSFTFGDSVRVIPRYLCYEMENLTSLSIGCEVDSIERHVFDGCKRISSVHWNARNCVDPALYTASPFYPFRSTISSFTFGDSVRHIPAYLCHGMNHLSRLYIPENVESIGDYAFRDLNALDSIYVHPNNTHFDSRNNCNALIDSDYDRLLLGCYKTQIPDDIHSIGACAFRRVRRLTSAIIPESVTNIEEEAFNGCADLDTVALPSTLTAINDYTFQDCSALDTIALPPTLQFIGIRAFSNCSALPEITLPDVIDYIDQYAFSNCSGFEQILCLATTPPTIKKTTFLGTSCPIYVPCPYLTSYRSAPVWEDYGTRVFGTFDYKLTVRPNDYFWGSDSIYQLPTCEANAIIYAEPHTGYEFVEWQDTLGHTLSTEQLYEFYVDEDITVIAVFREKQQALDAIDARTAVWVNERKVMLLSDKDVNARLYDITGRQVDACAAAANVTASLHAPASGVYVVVTDGRQQKVIVQ